MCNAKLSLHVPLKQTAALYYSYSIKSYELESKVIFKTEALKVTDNTKHFTKSVPIVCKLDQLID